MSETFSPVHMRWLSPSADDVIPTSLHAAYGKEPYPGEPKGAGRVHDLLDPSRRHVGKLWTNDVDGCGLMAAENGNPVYQTQIALLLREMNSQGVSASSAFDTISDMYAPHAVDTNVGDVNVGASDFGDATNTNPDNDGD